MAEGRMLKRKITKSKKLAALKTDKARLLWFYMLPFTDIEGRLEADAEDIRDEIIRKQRKGYTIDRIEECLRDLHDVGLITLYSPANRRFLEYSRFADEQTLRRDKEAESSIPSSCTGVIQEHDGISPAISKVKIREDKLSKDKLKEKTKYGEFVSMTKEEHQKLVDAHGNDFVKRCIEALDNYKGEDGKTYKSDYRAILNWVVDKVKKETGVKKGTTRGQANTPEIEFLMRRAREEAREKKRSAK